MPDKRDGLSEHHTINVHRVYLLISGETLVYFLIYLCLTFEQSIFFITDKLNTVCIFTSRNEVVAKVMFLLVSVILSTGGSASVHAGIPPPVHLPGSTHTPGSTHPPRKHRKHAPSRKHTSPWEAHPPWEAYRLGSMPPQEADSGIQSMSGRYASYWNAFLLHFCFHY